LRFAHLLATNAGAKRLVAEAAALDRLLDLAPRPSGAATKALSERIVAAAVAARAGDFREAGRGRQPRRFFWIPEALSQGRRGLAEAGSGGWIGGGLLAACLLIGAFAGTTGLVDKAIEPLAVAVGTEGDPDTSQLALDDDAAGLLEGDLL
jgi:hypothetical protein